MREAQEPLTKDAAVRGASNTFLLGEQETYAYVVAACWRIWGADTREWAELEAWYGDGGVDSRVFKK